MTSVEPTLFSGMHRRQFLHGGAALAAATMLGTGCASTPSAGMRQRVVKSSASDGVDLAVWESGNPNGRPVIFIHGFSQSHESWSKQMAAPELQRELRLIAFDLRGHGDSGKPLVKEAYHDPEKWAHDVQSVMRATGARQPALVAWSYGGRVLNDYLGVFGDGEVSSLNYVAATSTAAPFALGPQARLMGPMMSDDAAVADAGTTEFLKACFERQPSAAEMAEMKRFNDKTPALVRKLLGGRPAAYDETLRKIKVPVLVTHGRRDQILAVAMSDYTRKMVTQSTLSVYEGVGHATFFEEPARFNAELLRLAKGA